MEERRKAGYREVSERVERVRRIYSRIGEPLPADILIDLYRHLGSLPRVGEKELQNQKRRLKS